MKTMLFQSAFSCFAFIKSLNSKSRVHPINYASPETPIPGHYLPVWRPHGKLNIHRWRLPVQYFHTPLRLHASARSFPVGVSLEDKGPPSPHSLDVLMWYEAKHLLFRCAFQVRDYIFFKRGSVSVRVSELVTALWVYCVFIVWSYERNELNTLNVLVSCLRLKEL